MNKFSRDRVKGFLHTDGRRMVNGDGKTVVLRGWGMGNWMNPEGFMIGGVPLFVENADFNDFACRDGLSAEERWRQRFGNFAEAGMPEITGSAGRKIM